MSRDRKKTAKGMLVIAMSGILSLSQLTLNSRPKGCGGASTAGWESGSIGIAVLKVNRITRLRNF